MCRDRFEIQSYPTIKYFKDGDVKGTDFAGPPDYDQFKTFVRDELEIKCVVRGDMEGCTDKEKGYIKKMKGKSADDRAAQLKRLDGMKGNSMKDDLKIWLNQRLSILKQLEKATADEL